MTHSPDNTMNEAGCQEAGEGWIASQLPGLRFGDENAALGAGQIELVGVAIAKDTKDSAQHDLEIQPQGPVLSVPQVIFGPLGN